MSAPNYVAGEVRKIAKSRETHPPLRRALSKGEGTFCTTCASAMTHVCRGSALTKTTDKNFQSAALKFKFSNRKKLLTSYLCSGKVCLGRCGSCEFERRQMTDGWG